MKKIFLILLLFTGCATIVVLDGTDTVYNEKHSVVSNRAAEWLEMAGFETINFSSDKKTIYAGGTLKDLNFVKDYNPLKEDKTFQCRMKIDFAESGSNIKIKADTKFYGVDPIGDTVQLQNKGSFTQYMINYMELPLSEGPGKLQENWYNSQPVIDPVPFVGTWKMIYQWKSNFSDIRFNNYYLDLQKDKVNIQYFNYNSGDTVSIGRRFLMKDDAIYWELEGNNYKFKQINGRLCGITYSKRSTDTCFIWGKKIR